MNYYSVAFRYDGRTEVICGSDENASHALDKACSEVETALSEANICSKHQYAWTDGSLYRYVKSDLNLEKVSVMLRQIFHTPELCILSVDEVDPSSNPWKVGCKTVEEFFNRDMANTIAMETSL